MVVEQWLLVWTATVVLNMMPGFMPPTWSLLAYFHLRHALPVLPLAAVGATGAVIGRTLLALGSRAFGIRFLSPQRQANLQTLTETARQRKGLSLPILALFVLSPVPSNHLFIAAGLAKAPLSPLLIIFGLARFVSYLVWVAAVATAAQSLWEVLTPRFGSVVAVVVQLSGFILLVVLVRVDWIRLLQRWFPAKWQIPKHED